MAKPMSEERHEATIACVNIVKYIRSTQFYLSPTQAVMVVEHFWNKMGDKSMIDLSAYVKWAQKHGEPEERITATVCHDLNGASSRCFLPRSDGYTKYLKETE